MILSTQKVEKPWGRNDLPAAFGASSGAKTGEIWYQTDAKAALPLLIKWLFTSEKLSIQVHPSDAEAQKRGMASGKEECWVIVAAEPGAVLGIGTTRPLDSHELYETSLSGEIESLIDWKPVKAGDYYYIPAGTVHAIGAGVTLVEVQQYADITYRLFDYGRPRALHLDDGVAVSHAVPYNDARFGTIQGSARLVNGPFFDLWVIDGDDVSVCQIGGNRRWIVPLCGTATVGGHDVVASECWLDLIGADIVVAPGSKALVAVA